MTDNNNNSSNDTNETVTQERRRELHIAPMLDVSTPEFHALFRILSTRCILWTEMVVDETLVYTDRIEEHLQRQRPQSQSQSQPYDNSNDNDSNNDSDNESESDSNNENTKQPQPTVVCQLGGRSPDYCARATQLVESYGYDEINLNIDCPSARVSQKRRFGAALMKEPRTAVQVVDAMVRSVRRSKTTVVSVKTRIGVIDDDGDGDGHGHGYGHGHGDDLVMNFVARLRDEAGCRRFIIHARKCLLNGRLTPAQNRIVPPLNYPRVYQLCRQFPDCDFVLNGGIPGLEAAWLLCHGEQNRNHRGGEIVDDNTVGGDGDGGGGGGGDHDNDGGGAVNRSLTIDDRITAADYSNQQQEHAVPCALCKASNGSCIAPPPTAQATPSNLVGCMLGRAAMENPSMFWDVDRYFYGMDANPCQNRREVLSQYCSYLDRTYPRRCCDGDDDDARMTMRFPALKVNTRGGSVGVDGCDICRKSYETIKEGGIQPCQEEEESKHDAMTKIKISSKVIDRSLKPVLGIFFNLPRSKTFRRACDRLSRNLRIRNCGPGYILRKAIKDSMVMELLDANFIRTEDREEGDIPIHIAPATLATCLIGETSADKNVLVK